MRAAIDFGSSNTDLVARVDAGLQHWSLPHLDVTGIENITAALQTVGIAVEGLTDIAVTGGRHRQLPDRIGDCRIHSVDEFTAVAHGGLAMADLPGPSTPLLVVSGGSGVAMVAIEGNRTEHVTGTGFGGGVDAWFAYLLALIFLLFRPQGLFGEKIIERV